VGPIIAPTRGDGRRDLPGVLDGRDHLHRHDVLQPLHAVARLEVVEQRVVAQHVGRRLDLRREDTGEPGDDDGLEVGAGEPGVERVDPDEQAHAGVALADGADRLGDGRAGRRLAVGGTESSRSSTTQSAPEARALSSHCGLWPGTNRIER
jgi:hypothetical protein